MSYFFWPKGAQSSKTTYQCYNYPWSGRLGRIATCCLYCGDNGTSFQISSHAIRCLGENCPRYKGAEPIPELLAEYNAKFDKSVREWCDQRNIDYDATVKKYFDALGPQVQENPLDWGSDEEFEKLYVVRKI